MIECPVCAADVALSEGRVQHELKDCDDCGSELEVVGINPFRLEEAPGVEEDWGQ